MGLVDYAASDDDEKSAASSDNNSSSPSTDDESDRPAILKSLPSVHAAEKSDRGHQEEELEDVVKPRDWEKKLAEKAQKKKPASGESKERKKKSKKEKKEKKDKRKKVEDRAKQPKGRAKIAAFGALQTLDDSSSDEDSALPRPSTGPSSSAQLSAEALGTVGSKLGLFAALPKPKAATTVTTKLLVPTSVRAASALKPKAESLGQKKEAPKATATVNHSGGVKSDDDDDDDEAEGDGSDFFGFKKSAPSLAPSTDAAAPSALAPEVRLGSLAGPERPADQDEYNFGYEDDLVDEEDGPSSSSAIDKDHLPPTKRAKTITDDEAARLIFKHEMAPWGMDARFAAEAVTSMRSVNADDAIGDDIQQTLLRNLNHRQMATASAQQTAPKVKTSNDKDAKRRNQITYLANLAVSREEQMQNRWAEGNQKKRQTREKYGF